MQTKRPVRAPDHRLRAMRNRSHRYYYTLGPVLRILHVKNMGKDFSPEELRICPRLMGGPPATTSLTHLSLATWPAGVHRQLRRLPADSGGSSGRRSTVRRECRCARRADPYPPLRAARRRRTLDPYPPSRATLSRKDMPRDGDRGTPRRARSPSSRPSSGVELN